MGYESENPEAEAFRILSDNGCAGFFSGKCVKRGTKFFFVPKKKYRFLDPCFVTAESGSVMEKEITDGLCSGTFWKINTDAVCAEIREELPKVLEWLPKIPKNMLIPAFGDFGECLYHILYDADDPFLSGEADAMIKKNVSDPVITEDSIRISFYDLPLILSFGKEGMKVQKDSMEEKRALVCIDILDDFEKGMKMLEPLGDPTAVFHWNGEWLESVDLSYTGHGKEDGGAISVAVGSRDEFRHAVSDAAKALFAAGIEHRNEVKKKDAEKTKKELERLKMLAEDSASYGSYVCSSVLSVLLGADVPHDREYLTGTLRRELPSVTEEEVGFVLTDLEESEILSEENGQYLINDRSAAEYFADPKAYGTEGILHSDADFTAFIETADPESLSEEEWLDSLNVLDRTHVMEKKTQKLAEFFEKAPENLRLYLTLRTQTEDDSVKKKLIGKIAEGEMK